MTIPGRARRSSSRALSDTEPTCSPFAIRRLLDPSAAFGMLTWDDQGAEQNHRELDIEIIMGRSPHSIGQFVLQPLTCPRMSVRLAPGDAHAFVPLAAGPRVIQDDMRGNNAMAADVVAQHEFTSGVPTNRTRADEPALLARAPEPPRKDVEVVIERFRIYRKRGAGMPRLSAALIPHVSARLPEPRGSERRAVAIVAASGIDGAPNLAFLAVRSTPSPKQLTLSLDRRREGSFVSTV